MARLFVVVTALWLAVVTPARAIEGTAPCSPVGEDFPVAAPTDVRLSAWWLDKLLQDLDAQRYDIRALLVMRDCKLVLERYRQGVSRRSNHIVNSITKSVAATLVGRLIETGRLSGLDRRLDELIERPSGMRDAVWLKASRVTLRQAMTMSTGIRHDFQPGINPFYERGTDRLQAALEPEFVAEPGTRFNYSDGDAFLVGAAIASVARSDLYSFARSALFEPMAITNTDWLDKDRRGLYPGGYGLRMRPMDLLKLGQLYLQDGVWNGQRLLPPGYAAQTWVPAVSPDYGLQWWIRRGMYGDGVVTHEARGWKGQRIYVMLDGRTVVALAASLPKDEEVEVDRLIVSTIEQATRHGDDSPPESLSALAARQRAGFNGQTRVNQLAQDRPSFD